MVDHKVERTSLRKQEVFIKVKWAGYDEPTWESFKQFAQDSPECIQKYFIKLQKRLKPQSKM